MNKTFSIAGEWEVRRMGFGAMRLCGDGVWHWPRDREAAKEVLLHAVELGVQLIDTSDAYGPETNEYLIADTLSPYPGDVVIATKGGLVRRGPSIWDRDGRPEHLHRALINSLRRLEVETIDLYQLHAIDPQVPLEESLGMLKQMQDEGKIRHIGVSNFNVEELERARAVVDVVTVQNRYNLADREHDAVVDYCEEYDIGFLPWYPLAVGDLADDPRLTAVAQRHGATQAQIALAWLLHRSPVMLPIPGTSRVKHLEENCAAASILLSDQDLAELNGIG